MTANQIAYKRAREEERANQAQERIKQFEADSSRMKAKADERQAQTAFFNAMTNQQKVMLEEQKKDSEIFKNWTAGAQSIAKGIGSVVGSIASLFS